MSDDSESRSESSSRFEAALEKAASRLRAGGFIAYPTETVWGLGACVSSAEGLARLRAWKGREADLPMSLLVGGLAEAEPLGCAPGESARILAERFWPGPLTLVVPCRDRAPAGAVPGWVPGVGRADGALGLRCSDHPLVSALCAGLARHGLHGPITSTSLNRTGAPPARTRSEALRLLGPAEPRSLGEPLLFAPDGAEAGGQRPSSVVDCTGPRPRLLREAALSRGVLEAVVPFEAAAVPDPSDPPGREATRE